MPRKRRTTSFDEKSLRKGEKRKLEALRKSLGPEIADRAFAEWLAEKPTNGTGERDTVAEMIANELMKLVEREGVQFPRGGYLIRRGRGRVIVEQAAIE